jgi:hypothetical protein
MARVAVYEQYKSPQVYAEVYLQLRYQLQTLFEERVLMFLFLVFANVFSDFVRSVSERRKKRSDLSHLFLLLEARTFCFHLSHSFPLASFLDSKTKGGKPIAGVKMPDFCVYQLVDTSAALKMDEISNTGHVHLNLFKYLRPFRSAVLHM